MTIKQEVENLKKVNESLSNIINLQNSQILELHTKIDYLIEYQTGNWKIKDKKMTFYKLNNEVLEEYDLLNANGKPTNTSVFERVKL